MQRRTILLTLTTLFFISFSPLPSLMAAAEQQAATPNESQQKRQYEKAMEERLRKLGKQLDELKAKAAGMTEEARKDFNQYLVEAKKEQKSASRKLKEMRKESGTEWKKFSTELDKAAADLEKAYEKTKARFKE